ncbi:MAG: hypothetical protein ACM3QS_15230 [Bacteroidota bacterium]
MKAMRALRRFSALLLAFSVLSFTWLPSHAQTGDFQYFDQTGHNVHGEFLQFYRHAEDPTLLYGYPITEEYTRPDGLDVQYFQRARFELHSDLPAGQRVVLTRLGRDMYVPSTQVNIYSPLACRYYAETGYSVCFEFWDFFQAHGGVEQFGLPISPFEYRQETLVQYFEYARLEWQPWRQAGQRVVIADLGRIYFDKLGEDPGLLPPLPPLNADIQPLVLSMQVHAFVSKAIALPDDSQTVYVVVRDQRGQAISGADCTSAIRWPDARNEPLSAQTDREGVARLPFAFSAQPPGRLVYADVICSYRGVTGATRASFRIWY